MTRQAQIEELAKELKGIHCDKHPDCAGSGQCIRCIYKLAEIVLSKLDERSRRAAIIARDHHKKGCTVGSECPEIIAEEILKDAGLEEA